MQFAGGVNYLMDSRVAEFNYVTCFNINKMVVLTALVCSFKLSNVFPELMFNNQIAVKQQLNCII